MNQAKIGKFIADCRKEQNLTQIQLAEKLNITDKAVSKWERGFAMPDSSIMLDLCDILNISVNELLIGEKITTDNSSQKSKELFVDMAKELEQKNKIIWRSMCVLMIVSMVTFFASIFIAVFLIPDEVWKLIVIIASTILFLLPCFYALKLEVSVGVYKCKNCGCEIVPTYKEALMAMHKGTTRYLVCPKCNKRTWCKKVLDNKSTK